MKRVFLIKFLSVLLGCYLIYVILLVFFPWAIFYREFAMWMSKEEIMDRPGKYSLAVIGDSRALAAFLPEKISDHCYNLALGGGTPIEGYYTLTRLVKTGKVKKLIVSYAPFHLESTDTFFDRTVKFSFLKPGDLYEVFYYSFLYNQKFWDDESTAYRNTLEKAGAAAKAGLTWLNVPFYYKAELSNLSPFSRYHVNMAVYMELSKTRGHFNFGTAEFSSGLSKEADREQFVLNKVCDVFLEKTFTLARENHIRVLYKIAPCNTTSFNHLKEKYITDYNRFMEGLQKRFPEIVFDYRIIPYSDSLFGDPSHLNKRGCIRFSAEFRNQYISWIED